MTEEPTNQVVPVTPDTRATSPARTTSIASTNKTSFEGDTTMMITSDERELAIKGYLPEGAITLNALAQVPSIIYKFEALWADDPTVRIGWEQHNAAAMQLINRKFPNILSGLGNPYDHIKSQIDTTKVLQESYLDLLTKIQARKYVPNPLGPAQYFVDMVCDQFQANQLKESPITDGIVMMCALVRPFGGSGHTKGLLTIMEESWFMHYESTIGQERTMGKANATPKYELFKSHWTKCLTEAFVNDDTVQPRAKSKANLVTVAIVAQLSVLETRHDLITW
eukprot:jgi/Psemu1/531/gm1.531_g